MGCNPVACPIRICRTAAVATSVHAEVEPFDGEVDFFWLCFHFLPPFMSAKCPRKVEQKKFPPPQSTQTISSLM